MASRAASDFEDSINTSVFEQSSPESLHPRTFSPPAHDNASSTSSGLTLHEIDEDYFGSKGIKQCTSSRSSISSFPSSVIHNIQFTDNEDFSSRTPSRTQYLHNGRSSPAIKPSGNSYLAAFRNPSSVRALQLESEYADSDTYSVARSPRHKSPKMSYFVPRSPGSTQSSPTKRSSRPGTPQQKRNTSKLKKEFPLVLLHCTLLPPATTTRGSLVSEEILEAILPEEYRKSWRTLQDKVVKNAEVKQRGVLIAHPRDDYDLLEERLLEALELERPRIRKGHYIGTSKSDSDSGFESSSQNETDEGSEADERDDDKSRDKCPDCGKAVSCKVEQDRRWEIKIFAANGLMRSSAWSAAWEQMEKIDVEVAVWMPEDVRFEVEERLKAIQAKEQAEKLVEEPVDPPKKKRTRSNTARVRHDERMREIYGEPEKAPIAEEVNEAMGTAQPEATEGSVETPFAHTDTNPHDIPVPHEEIFVPRSSQQHNLPPQADFPTYMKHHFRIIINDQRNLAIVLLSMMVLFFSIQNLDSNSTQPVQSTDVTNGETTALPLATSIPILNTEATSVLHVTSSISADISNPSPTNHYWERPDEHGSTSHIEEHISVSPSPFTEQPPSEPPVAIDAIAPETESYQEPETTMSHEQMGDPNDPNIVSLSPSLALFTNDICRPADEWMG